MTIFGDRSTIGREKCFAPSDLLDHAEQLIKLTKNNERYRAAHNYGWLSSKTVEYRDEIQSINNSILQLKPMIDKMSPESCIAISVKLDSCIDSLTVVTTATIFKTLHRLLEEQQNLQLMENSLKEMKNRGSGKKILKRNKVKPELMPPGREAMVSFVLDVECFQK